MVKLNERENNENNKIKDLINRVNKNLKPAKNNVSSNTTT